MNDSQIYNYVWETSQILCSEKHPHTVLLDFFHYLQKIIPIKAIFIGEHDSLNFSLKIFSITTETKTQVLNIEVPFSKKEIETAKSKKFFDIKTSQLIYIKNNENELAPLYYFIHDIEPLKIIEENTILSYRIVGNERRYGGLGLIIDKNFTLPKELFYFFELLIAPLSIFLNSYYFTQKTPDSSQNKTASINQKKSPDEFTEIIGKNGGLKSIIEQVNRVAPLNVPILIRGETGTGKEVIAREIHTRSALKNKPFIAVNCGAIPSDLIDSELFGHAKDSFTGAISEHIGFFEQANGGTLFLDEVAELPLSAQVRLLRVLQEKKLCKIGSSKETAVDFRLIAATHRPLEEMVKIGTFREDLFYRINVIPLEIPPLRKRKEDIPLLADYFIRKFCKQFNMPIPFVSPKEIEKLQQYPFPGNIRQLQNMIIKETALIHNNQLIFHMDGLMFNEPEHTEFSQLPQDMGSNEIISFDELVKNYLEKMLVYCNGRINGKGGMAELAKLNCGTLRAKLDKYHIPYGRKEKNSNKN